MMKTYKTPFTKFVAMTAILLSMVLTSGCATVNDFLMNLGGKEENPPLEKIKTAPRYSDNQNMGVPTDRQYKKMTRSRMEEESDVGSTAGSAWVMEGQGAYLFAQNKMRREGDMVNVKLDAPAQKQVETKVGVIKKLLKQLEDQEKGPALNNSLAANGDANRAPAAEAAPATKAEEKKEDDKDALADVQNIPSKIVEKLPDGNYRVKGQQPFMIGKREYKVILTGMLRPEDFNDEGITSQKLLDPQYDVVSIRRNSTHE